MKSSKAKASPSASITRRGFLAAVPAASALAATAGALVPPRSSRNSLQLEEITLAELKRGFDSGRFTSRALVEEYLDRILKFDRSGPRIKGVIEVNPEALAIADALDRRRRAGHRRRALEGVPVLIKDNIATCDRMQTTAGSLALEGSRPPRDSFVAAKLRAAGAVILGKTNLSEWANFRSSFSTSGWSGRGGLTRNPYALDRNPCGSSSGSGAAASANLCALAVGTETDGSVVCPSSTNGLVGIKPTVGLIGRSGIIPISHTQDTAGPMARTVTDAAALLGAMAGVDLEDSATTQPGAKRADDYTRFLDARGLKGARLGVVRSLFGFNEDVDRLMEQAIEALRHEGAVVVDPVAFPSKENVGDSEMTVLLYEFKSGLNEYLAALGADAPVHSLAEVIAFNRKNRIREMPYFGQDLFVKAEAKGPLTDKTYLDALAKCRRISRAEGIDGVMDQFKLDALVAPTAGPAWTTDLVNGDHDSGSSSTPPAVAGYPHITVPAGTVFGLPVGISFFGRAWSESVLIRIAYGYEQATRARRAPKFLPTANLKVA